MGRVPATFLPHYDDSSPSLDDDNDNDSGATFLPHCDDDSGALAPPLMMIFFMIIMIMMIMMIQLQNQDATPPFYPNMSVAP